MFHFAVAAQNSCQWSWEYYCRTSGKLHPNICRQRPPTQQIPNAFEISVDQVCVILGWSNFFESVMLRWAVHSTHSFHFPLKSSDWWLYLISWFLSLLPQQGFIAEMTKILELFKAVTITRVSFQFTTISHHLICCQRDNHLILNSFVPIKAWVQYCLEERLLSQSSNSASPNGLGTWFQGDHSNDCLQGRAGI